MTAHESPHTEVTPGATDDLSGFTFLKSKFQIGSCKGPINFKPSENVFHVDDIPPVKKAKKKEVLNWKRSRILSLSRGAWDSSTMPPHLIPPKNFSANFVHDRRAYVYNYRAEVLPPKNLPALPKPHKFKVHSMSDQQRAAIKDAQAQDRVLAGYLKRVEEMPVHPKLADKKPWSASTLLTKAELRARNAKLAADSAARSALTTATLHNYVDPKTRYELVLEDIRRNKRQLRATGPPHEPKPRMFNRLAKEPEARYKTFHHSGVWELNKLEGEWMWSDTGSFCKESEGDVVKVHDPNRYNFASP